MKLNLEQRINVRNAWVRNLTYKQYKEESEKTNQDVIPKKDYNRIFAEYERESKEFFLKQKGQM